MQMRQFFTDKLHITDPALLQRMLDISTCKEVPKGQILTHVGEIPKDVIFLLHGIVRSYSVDEDGNDVTDCLSNQCGDAEVPCNLDGTPSPLNIVTLTDCRLIYVSGDKLMKLVSDYPQVAEIYNGYLLRSIQSNWEIRTITQYTAMDRYRWFLNKYPGLIDQVSNQYVASFLDMSTVTLSRLRRQLRAEELPPAGRRR